MDVVAGENKQGFFCLADEESAAEANQGCHFLRITVPYDRDVELAGDASRIMMVELPVI